MLDRVALFVVIVGCVYLGVTGIFNFELINCELNSTLCLLKRFVYALVGVCGVWCCSFFFKFKHGKPLEF